ncbi:hypothetical protein ACFO25_19770 [Paenactinomyces guangxiensis]|uniref:Uncharacterized protein n=1 Tax=Paenactinomyces guangxiensis TaxID=1490290 RepID=A0A7W1WUE0_9BACL|nr:hypothetical protein [Paenactinomyces guangxiensis]MBA4496253.1 hypothetical protein [Paenactinomyces guangxiensis]MBH8593365.1 hypothetical protein [Paenactinomyces guangxiensis]
MQIRFQTPYQYLFIHQNVKHLLLLWKKERKRELYIIEEENDGTLLLRFPGETYAEMVLQEIEPIFFQRLETEEGLFPAILGATFTFEEKLIGMYYHRDHPTEELYFFEIQGETLTEISDQKYEAVVHAFMNEFPEYFSG